jgi:hypothetical protein
MNPWEPILSSGTLPAAAPIHVLELPPDDLEAAWWAHLLAALAGLRTAYCRLNDQGQVYRTGRVLQRALAATNRLYPGMAEGLYRAAMRAASFRLMAWDWQEDPLPLETGLWAQAAYCAHALAAGYTFAGGLDDARALLAADVLKAIRERVLCALPDDAGRELLDLATSTRWDQSQPTGPMPGTTEGHEADQPTMEEA